MSHTSFRANLNLAKWLSVRSQNKWLWVRIPLLALFDFKGLFTELLDCLDLIRENKQKDRSGTESQSLKQMDFYIIMVIHRLYQH